MPRKFPDTKMWFIVGRASLKYYANALPFFLSEFNLRFVQRYINFKVNSNVTEKDELICTCIVPMIIPQKDYTPIKEMLLT